MIINYDDDNNNDNNNSNNNNNDDNDKNNHGITNQLKTPGWVALHENFYLFTFQ